MSKTDKTSPTARKFLDTIVRGKPLDDTVESTGHLPPSHNRHGKRMFYKKKEHSNNRKVRNIVRRDLRHTMKTDDYESFDTAPIVRFNPLAA